ncbi:MAG: response regulator, partial [Bdellovibrionota bacterium]
MNDLKRFTILIVDDDEALRRSIAFDFERRGFTILMASTGNAALELMSGAEVHLVISDMQMPDGNGLRLMSQAQARFVRVPLFVFVTGWADTAEAECIQKGAAKVFAKPFDRKELMKYVM